MTWFKFSICLALLYTLYYSGLIFWELLRARRKPAGDDTPELTFAEDASPPQTITEEALPAADLQSSSVVSSGGVLIKEIFKLAQEEAIEYIRPVSF